MKLSNENLLSRPDCHYRYQGQTQASCTSHNQFRNIKHMHATLGVFSTPVLTPAVAFGSVVNRLVFLLVPALSRRALVRCHGASKGFTAPNLCGDVSSPVQRLFQCSAGHELPCFVSRLGEFNGSAARSWCPPTVVFRHCQMTSLIASRLEHKFA
jgi:hypothetical protein